MARFQHCLIQILLFKAKKIDFLIVGLGNPGSDYEHTLHNVGFDVVDRLGQELGTNYWKSECGSKTTHLSVYDKEIILAKPQSFMNTSGGPVSEICKKYKLTSANLLVVHDDLDLDPGVFRAKRGGGAGGHNGIKSIHQKLGKQDFLHFKVGIGHPPGRKPVTDWVLSKPIKPNMDVHAAGIETCISALKCYLETANFEEVQRRFN